MPFKSSHVFSLLLVSHRVSTTSPGFSFSPLLLPTTPELPRRLLSRSPLPSPSSPVPASASNCSFPRRVLTFPLLSPQLGGEHRWNPILPNKSISNLPSWYLRDDGSSLSASPPSFPELTRRVLLFLPSPTGLLCHHVPLRLRLPPTRPSRKQATRRALR